MKKKKKKKKTMDVMKTKVRAPVWFLLVGPGTRSTPAVCRRDPGLFSFAALSLWLLHTLLGSALIFFFFSLFTPRRVGYDFLGTVR